MISWLKEQIFNVIAVAILVCFAGVWIYIMREVAGFAPTEKQPKLTLATGVVTAAGLLGTTISTITASALGFTVAEVKAAKRTANQAFTAKAVGEALSTPTLFAVLTYIAISVAVFFTWTANEAVAPDVLSVYALSSLGWLVGSASVAFKANES